MPRAGELASLLADAGSLAIVPHDNPDPDALASAIALEEIARSCGIEEVAIGYGGDISHQQNRAFVNLLEIDADPLAAVELEAFDCIAFVDHARPGENTAVPASTAPDVVVDHHPDADEVDARFADVRPEYGATATIFVEYLEALEAELTTRLASALLFAIHRERLDFAREPTRREYEAALAVYPEADLEILEQLYGTAFSPATIDAIGRAIANRQRRSSSLVASAGRTTEGDALPQAADYLLNVEGVDTVLVYGVVDGVIRLSGRSVDSRVHMGKTLKTAFEEFGSVGGHQDMAGGTIELGLFADDGDDDDALLSFVGKRLERRFFDALGLGDGDEE